MDYKKMKHVAVDSREVVEGAFFFALRGARANGHDFLEEVAKKGGVAAVVEEGYTGPSFGMTLIHVQSVLDALQQLAKKKMEECAPFVIAVTGSIGKTTTKEFIATLLEKKYTLFKSPGNHNSQIGLPLALLNASPCDVMILEMAMSESGQIANLVKLAPPDIAVVTRISYGHFAHFASFEKIAEAKSEIFSSPRTRLGVISDQAAGFPAILKGGRCKKCIYGLQNTQADYFMEMKGEAFTLYEQGHLKLKSILPHVPSHLAENALAAIAVAREIDLSWQEIEERLSFLKPHARRFETVIQGGIHFINDAYNANPETMAAALTHLPKPKGGKTIAVLGKMVDLAEISETCHLEVGHIALSHVDHLLCLHEACDPMVELFHRHAKPAERFVSLKDLKERLFHVAQPGDVVLIKGSNFLRMWELLV